MKSESSLILHRQLKCSLTQKHSKDICKTVHVTSVAQLPFCEATRILFVRKENKSNNLFNYSSPRVTIVCILSPESNQFNQHCLYSGENTCMLNVNNADYVDYFLGKVHTIVHVLWYSPKERKMVTRIWEHFSCVAVYAESESSQISSKISLF